MEFMRHSLWLIVLFAAQAHATFLQIDVHVLANQTSEPNWSLELPSGAIDARIIIDTSQAPFIYGTQTGSDGTSCFSSVDFGVSARLLDLSIGGVSLASGRSDDSGVFGGDRPNPSCGGGQAFFAGFGFHFGDLTMFISPDSRHDISMADVLAAPDSAAALLLAGNYGGFLGLRDAAGQGAGYYGYANSNVGGMTITQVGEPETLGLFALALTIGLAFTRRRAGPVPPVAGL